MNFVTVKCYWGKTGNIYKQETIPVGFIPPTCWRGEESIRVRGMSFCSDLDGTPQDSGRTPLDPDGDPPRWTDKYMWKHYLAPTSFAGGNNTHTVIKLQLNVSSENSSIDRPCLAFTVGSPHTSVVDHTQWRALVREWWWYFYWATIVHVNEWKCTSICVTVITYSLSLDTNIMH